uniref:Ribosomal RNA-processing protein 43 n=1 Tax=Zea mays TaxID=4577 RepID=A0A804LU56_MAIZE
MAAETKPAAASGVAGEMEVEAYRRLFPVAFLERHLGESVRIDARRLREARPTTVALGAVSSAHGSALARLGDTAMLASVKLEVMSPPAEHPDEGSVAVEFHMPPICSPLVRPGRPTDVAPVISKALEDVLTSSGMLNLKDLCLITGKASWLAYLDIYCLNADGSLFDAALISAVAAFTHLFRLVVKLSALLCSPLQIMEIPLVSVGDDGRLFTVGGNDGKNKFELVNREKRKLTLDSSDRLVSLQKLGGAVTCMATIKECISLAKERRRSLREILLDSIKAMEVDQTE